jgi:hypothetical protein
MEEIYKEHIIRPGARRVPHSTTEWQPTVQISWREGSSDFVKTWTESDFKRDFPTKEEAEREGLLFAKKWIDDGNQISN